jgi:hypothetical protein
MKNRQLRFELVAVDCHTNIPVAKVDIPTVEWNQMLNEIQVSGLVDPYQDIRPQLEERLFKTVSVNLKVATDKLNTMFHDAKE